MVAERFQVEFLTKKKTGIMEPIWIPHSLPSEK